MRKKYYLYLKKQIYAVNTIYTERANHAQEYILNEELMIMMVLYVLVVMECLLNYVMVFYYEHLMINKLNIDDPQVNINSTKFKNWYYTSWFNRCCCFWYNRSK